MIKAPMNIQNAIIQKRQFFICIWNELRLNSKFFLKLYLLKAFDISGLRFQVSHDRDYNFLGFFRPDIFLLNFLQTLFIGYKTEPVSDNLCHTKIPDNFWWV